MDVWGIKKIIPDNNPKMKKTNTKESTKKIRIKRSGIIRIFAKPSIFNLPKKNFDNRTKKDKDSKLKTKKINRSKKGQLTIEWVITVIRPQQIQDLR